jgi:hypothetical protein
MAESTAEPGYQIIEHAGTPILNGSGGARHIGATYAQPPIEAKVTITSGTSSPVPRTLTTVPRTLDWDDLYPTEVGRSALVIRARKLLADGQQSLNAALAYISDDEPVRADYEITLFQGAIPELFCCNSIGESFAAIVVALRWALKNRRGDPLTSEQLRTVLNCVARLNKELFMSYDTALTLIDDLESVGLNTDVSIATHSQLCL